MENLEKRVGDMYGIYQYKGIGFQFTNKGYWVFDQLPPKHPYDWNRYFKKGEEDRISLETMKKAIDRCLDGIWFKREG